LRAKKVEKLHNSSYNSFNKWRLTVNFENVIPEPGTTISGFADNKKKKKKDNPDRPTLDFFDI
jgi:hypothetical protein